MTDNAETQWKSFLAVNARRRSIRDFDGRPIDEAALREVLAEGLKAPSSGNLQPYTIHWVRNPQLKTRVADACEGQRAARSASALLVLVSSVETARKTVAAQREWVEHSGELSDASKAYHRKQLDKFGKFLRFAPMAMLGLFRVLLSFFVPARALVPIGRAGIAHWATRSTLYAAQQVMTAATARGFDTCPMEGFDPGRVAKLLELPRGSVVPLVIAVGHRTSDAHLEPQWRRAFDDAVVVH
ncbi:MAG: nitroreductase family protein [Archangium sp.]